MKTEVKEILNSLSPQVRELIFDASLEIARLKYPQIPESVALTDTDYQAFENGDLKPQDFIDDMETAIKKHAKEKTLSMYNIQNVI